MSEEIKIGVSAPGAEDVANKIARLKKEAEGLKRVGDFREAQGDQAGAKFARQDAGRVEKELTTLTRGRVNDEREITRERSKQAAEEKLTSRKSMRIAGSVAKFAEGQVGAGGFGGLTSAVGAAGGPLAAIVAAVAAIGAGIAVAFAKQKDQRELIGMEQKSDRTIMDRRLRRASSFEGSAAGSRADAEGYKDELIALNSKRQVLQKKAQFKFYNPAGWIDQMTGASENAIEEHDGKIRDAEHGLTESRKETKKKFAENGRLELRAMEARAKGARKEAREMDRTRQWSKDYNEALNSGADEDQGEASRIANAKMHETMVGQGRAIGRNLGSNAGAAEIARVAGIAANPNAEVKESISHLTAFLRSQHDETSRQAWRHQFERTLK